MAPLITGLALLLVIPSGVVAPPGSDPATDDWAGGCPKPACLCKWISGKRTADCKAAGLSSLPQFAQPDMIQVLHLEGNPLRELPKSLFQKANLINLQKIYMTNCSLHRLDPTAFQGLVLLIELDLSHNLLKGLEPGTFEGNIRIRKLWLSHNPIKALTGFSFPVIKHLRLLDLSHCQLKRLDRATFMQLTDLEVLHLNDNHFKRLDKRIFTPIKGIKSLTLERNPWLCDCRLQDFWNWLMANMLFNHPTACDRPVKLQGVPWDQLSRGALACPPEVLVPEPMVTMSTGDVVRLACLVTSSPGTKLSWVRSGVVIGNNTRSPGQSSKQGHQYFTIREGSSDSDLVKASLRHKNVVTSVIDGSEPKPHIFVPSHVGKKWFNLTIDNVNPSGSGGYTCVAQNEGGVAEGNVTVVYSESVATYLDKSEISTLLVMASSASVMVIFCIGVFMVCFVFKQKLNVRQNHNKPMASTTASTSASARHHVVQSTHDSHELLPLAPGLRSDQVEPGDSSSSSNDDLSAKIGSGPHHQLTLLNANYNNFNASFDSGKGSSTSTSNAAAATTATTTPPPPEKPVTGSHQIQVSVRATPMSPLGLKGPGPAEGSLMDRMWRKEIGSRTHLLGSSGSLAWHQSPQRRPIGNGALPENHDTWHYSMRRSGWPPSTTASAASAEASIKKMAVTSNPGSLERIGCHRQHPTFPHSNGRGIEDDSPSQPRANPDDDEHRMAILAQEVRARRQLLEALVRDKTDTVV